MSCAGVIGCPEATSSHVDLPELAAANKSTRVARRLTPSTAVFWGAGAWGRFFAETRSVYSRVLSAVWSGPVRMRGQRFLRF